MTHSDSIPFAGLRPERILDAVESLGYRCDGALMALNSYENRVWQIGIDDGPPLIAKFYRPERWSDAQIAEEHAFSAAMVAVELPVVAPLVIGGKTLFVHGGFRFSLFPRQGGRAPEFAEPEILEWMGRLMARIHLVGAREPFVVRETLDIQRFGIDSRDWLLANHVIPPELEPVWQGVADQALEGVRHCYARAGQVQHLRLHGDCHAGNVLWTQDGPHFVDFDDARMGPAIQDLWMLLSGDAEEMGLQFGHVLAGYETFREFDDRELQLVEALRTLRLLHHSAWLARRWNDPAFPAAFPWFATNRYWEERILELREQIAAMQESALVPR
ncbi:MAG: putative homoserine kinase type II (protein kinase fold) [Rhodocyclaceae bacterium]|nr:MAG: putative homoserine kinase type II (protein kinase fold) [Rhodocyclaceae bacterium]TND03741.1 MAG: putative homoserine kinase type II (protein kinase fold) [Rhodocyclaceae bacterium]